MQSVSTARHTPAKQFTSEPERYLLPWFWDALIKGHQPGMMARLPAARMRGQMSGKRCVRDAMSTVDSDDFQRVNGRS
jgi:hypothetical protein